MLKTFSWTVLCHGAYDEDGSHVNVRRIPGSLLSFHPVTKNSERNDLCSPHFQNKEHHAGWDAFSLDDVDAAFEDDRMIPLRYAEPRRLSGRGLYLPFT